MRNIFVLPLAFVLASGLASHASAQALVFVAPNAIDAADMLAPPPADDSALNKAEIAELHRIEKHRTAADIAAARADERERDIFIFEPVLGPRFNAEALPLTATLSRHVEDTEQADIEPVKNVFRRVRPYNFDTTLHPVCRTKTNNDSYPSGHTMTDYLMALTLASMLPEHRAAIFARADAYAQERLVCGVHHPSDLEAGKELAYALFALMAATPRFKAERAAAEVELRKVLQLQTSRSDPRAGHD